MKRLALWEDPFGLSPLRQGSAQASISQPFVLSLSKLVLRKLEGLDGSPFDALRVSG